jgi:hypothetical protein
MLTSVATLMTTTAVLQGRVFGLQRLISEAASPAAALIAGPLADNYFEPWLQVRFATLLTLCSIVLTVCSIIELLCIVTHRFKD